MAEDMGERTELPSERRLQDARERGQVAKSADLASALDLIGVLILLVVFGGGVMRAMSRIMRELLAGSAYSLSLPTMPLIARDVLVPCALAVGPILGLIVVATLIANLGQIGILFTTQPLMPKFDRLSPVKGVQNLFNRRNLIRTGQSVVKITVISWVGYAYLTGAVDEVAALPMLSASSAMLALAEMMLRLAIWLLALLLILGVVDFMFQRWQHTQELKMTRQEVMDERRSMEGDPQIKGRRARMMRQIAMQQVSAAVPHADVVVTNPTHYSVAIEYDATTMHAPRVVAKGVDFMAMRIRQVAALHAVPIVERPPLARALYADVEVGQEVRPEFYQAIAELLAFVYRLEKEAAA